MRSFFIIMGVVVFAHSSSFKPSVLLNSPRVEWGENLLASAEISDYSSEMSVTAEADTNYRVENLFDGFRETRWKCDCYNPPYFIILKLKKESIIKRIAIYNSFTDARGTGGGNDALKELEVWATIKKEPINFKKIALLEVIGPKPVCKSIGGFHICWFEPLDSLQVFELPSFKAKYLKLILKSAHWSKIALKTWPEELSFCCADIMAFAK